jgi:hypothetical protein
MRAPGIASPAGMVEASAANTIAGARAISEQQPSVEWFTSACRWRLRFVQTKFRAGTEGSHRLRRADLLL